MSTTWLVRKTGSDSNGGTSKTVRSTVSDGVTNGTNTLTSASNPWVAGDVGHGIQIAGVWRLVATFNSAGSITFSGATIAAGSGKTVIVGGSLLTVGKILNSGTIVAPGDSIYVGAGTYRTAAITWATSGTAGNIISLIGDVDGALTGDVGDVVLTDWTTNDTTASAGSAILVTTAISYISVANITFVGSASNLVGGIGTTGSTHNTFTNCHFISNTFSSTLVTIVAATDTNGGHLFDSCVFVGGYNTSLLKFAVVGSATAAFDCGGIIRNCLFFAGSQGPAITATNAGANTKYGGGLKIAGCTIFGGDPAIQALTHWASDYPVNVIGTYVFGAQRALLGFASAMALVADYCLLDVNTPVQTMVTTGPGCVTDHSYAPLLEWFTARIVGRRSRSPLVPSANSPLLGFLPAGTQIAVGIPGTGADDATVGTISWTNPTNVQAADGSFATCVMTTGTTGHYLKVTNHGFALPSTATVVGIRVEFDQKTTVTNNALPNAIKLVKGGTIGGNDNSASWTTPSATDTVVSVGGVGDLWGQAWLYSDINDATFGVAISAKDTSGSSSTLSIDYVRIIVTYTDSAATPTEQTVDFNGNPRPAGGASAASAVGAYERGNTATAVVSPVTGYGFLGPGYQDHRVEVDATPTTITIYGQYDASYGSGTKPTLYALANAQIGVTLQTSTMTAVGASTRQQLSVSFTPTAKGIVTIRLASCAAAAGNCYFDTAG